MIVKGRITVVLLVVLLLATMVIGAIMVKNHHGAVPKEIAGINIQASQSNMNKEYIEKDLDSLNKRLAEAKTNYQRFHDQQSLKEIDVLMRQINELIDKSKGDLSQPEINDIQAEMNKILDNLKGIEMGRDLGEKKPVTPAYVVDLDADAIISSDGLKISDIWKIEEHVKGGKFKFDPAKIALYLDEEQHGDEEQDNGIIEGTKLREKLKGKPVLNVNMLNFLLAHQELIPEDWKGKDVCFWGTIYSIRGMLFVPILVWNAKELQKGWQGWHQYGYRLEQYFDSKAPAAILAPIGVQTRRLDKQKKKMKKDHNPSNEYSTEAKVVNLDADPYVPDGLKVVEHIKGGQFKFDPAKVALYLDKEQQNGNIIFGYKLREKLKGKPVFNANLLDFYLDHPELIPEEWKSKGKICFWGTIYSTRNTLCVRYLDWPWNAICWHDGYQLLPVGCFDFGKGFAVVRK